MKTLNFIAYLSTVSFAAILIGGRFGFSLAGSNNGYLDQSPLFQSTFVLEREVTLKRAVVFWGMAIDNKDQIWVLYLNFGKKGIIKNPEGGIEIFTPKGKLFKTINLIKEPSLNGIFAKAGKIYASAVSKDKVYVFNPQGKKIREIEINLPMGIRVDNDGNLYKGRREWVKREKRKDRYFKHQRELTSREKSLAELRKEEADMDFKEKSFYIHKYDSLGNYICSFFPVEGKFKRLQLYQGRVYLDIDDADNIYAVCPVSKGVYKFSPSGELLTEFTQVGPEYKPIPSYFDNENLKGKDRWEVTERFHSECISREGIFCWDDYVIALLRQSEEKRERYFYDIYDREGNLLLGGIESSYKLLTIDQTGRFYFLIPSSSKGVSRIGIFRLNFSQRRREGQ